MKNEREKGFYLTEVLLVAALTGLIFLAIVRLLSPTLRFFQGSQARQQANMQARVCLETIQRVMSNGKASSLVVSTPPTIPPVGSSQARFYAVDGSTYTITWSTAPMNTVHLQKWTTPSGSARIDTVLATHVTGLHFTFDTHDPGIVQVTLEIKVPLDATGLPGHFYTISLPNQTVLMVAS